MASNNEKVSDLLELYATDIQSNDILLATDMTVRESKKLEIGQLLLFIESSGSFFAYDSTHAGTASYILASGVNGVVAVASNASQSISSSWANSAGSSSYASTSSLAFYALTSANNNANTASFLQYSPNNGSASYASNAGLSNNAVTAYNLYYNGQPNGTSSWAINASNAISTSYSVTSSNANTSSFAFSSTSSSFASYSTSASVSLQSNQSQTASYLVNYGPHFISPQAIYNSPLSTGWTTVSASAYIPNTATCVILQAYAYNTNNTTPTQNFIYISKDSISPYYILIGYTPQSSMNAGQGVFPISTTQTFQFRVTAGTNQIIHIDLIGYY